MAYIQLNSENTKLSWIIQKNPETGLIPRTIRKGHAFGWFTPNNENEYNVFFDDGKDEISFKEYKDQEFEYISTTKFNSPIFLLSVMDEFFRSAYKGGTEEEKFDTEGHINSFLIGLVEVKKVRFVEFFQKHFKDYDLVYEQVQGKNYKIKITTKKTIKELLNFVNIFTIIIAIINEEYMDLNDDKVVKFIESLNIVDSPYYIRYLFKIKLIRKKSQFDKYKDILEKSSYQKIKMQFSDTWVMRKNEIESNLDFSNHIVDLGCNDGRYLPVFARKLGDKKYFAIDIDEEVLRKAKRRAENKNILNAEFFSSLDEFEKNNPEEKVDFIFVEVMEHMPEEVGKELIKRILSFKNLNKLIITTPCKEFNQFYFDDQEEMRHHDHDFELTRSEFKRYIESFVKDFQIEYLELGDTVNGIPISQGCSIERGG